MSQVGSILFIGMKNFMTFRDVSFSPGPGFNVVLGPNGAGKSSIVSAITLGLGGDVVTLRRQASLADFVNCEATADHAEILIRLRRTAERGSREAHEVLCKVYKDNHSEFWLDGKKVVKQAVASLARKLQIQTNNLCQFLPQDVVREFPEMSPQKVFMDTIRAVGDQATLDLHASLKASQVECDHLKETVKTKRNTLLVLEKKNSDSDELRQAEESRKKLGENIELHELQANYLSVRRLREDVKRKKREKANLKNERDSAATTVSEMKDNMKDYHQEKLRLEKIVKENKAVVDASSRGMSESKVTRIESEVDKLSRDLRALDDRLYNREQQLEVEEDRLRELEEELQRFDKDELEAAKDRLVTQYGASKLRLCRQQGDLKQLQQELGAAESGCANLAQKRKRITTDDVIKLNLLRQRNPDAYEGVDWLRRNCHLFAQTVYEPIMMNIQLADPSYACYVQKIVGAQDLEAFVCDSAEDTSKLMNCLRLDRRLRRINVVQSSSCSSSQLQSPVVPACLTSSFVDFVDNMIACPDSIRSFLRKAKKLHEIPVFSDDANSDLVGRYFRKYFIHKTLFVVRTGRYSKSPSTTVEQVGRDRYTHFPSGAAGGGTGGDDELAALDKEIRKQESVSADLRGQIDRAQLAIREAEAECARCFKQVEDNRMVLLELEALENKLQMSSSRLAVLRSKKHDKELVKLREDKEVQLQQAVVMLSKALEEIERFVGESAKAAIEIQLHSVKLSQVEGANMEKTRELATARERFQTVASSLKTAESEYNKLLSQFKTSYEQLDWAPKNSMETPPEISKKLQQSCPAILSQVQAKLSTLREELRHLPVFTDAQKREAKEIGKKVEDARGQVSEFEDTLRSKEADNLRGETALVDRVNHLVESIDGKFRVLMELMGNTGEVQLQGAGTADFRSYGLCIMVKFANSKGCMQKLSADVQSGGEKSVTTALYMMALQELTKVPFRCVDEINQGMDETNEKRIWELLLKTANRYSAQYFYLVPKFPRHLEFSDNMSVNVCLSGSMKRRRDWETIVQDTKRRRRVFKRN